jgi:hypothetical protein
MAKFSKIDRILLLIACLLVLIAPSQSAYAYLDPGNTSFIFQILIGFILSSLFFVRMFWTKIVGMVRGNRAPIDTSTESDPPNQQ